MMPADSSIACSTLADAVYAKTAHGRLEVAHRNAGLGARERSVLIMLDGRKTAAALAALMPGAPLGRILDELVERGLIARAGPAAAADDEARLASVKTLLIRSADTYLGPIGADLVRQIGAAGNDHQLQRAVGHWHMAMQESKYGWEVVEAQLALVRANLQAAPSAPA